MKYAILFTFAAFAFLAQADAKTAPFRLPEIGDRGAIADYLKEKLAAAKEKFDEMLKTAQDALKQKINEAKKTAEHLIEQLKQAADKINDKVFEAANKILDKLEAGVAESMPEKSQNIEGISECMIMKDNFRQAVLSVVANTSSCITDKIEEAKSYVVDIYTLTTKAFGAIKEVKDQSIECTRDIRGIKKIAAAIVCVTKASAKGTVVVGKTVSAVSIDVTKLINEISTLQTSLSFCLPTRALITLAQQVQPVVVSIKDCIKEKIEKAAASKESSKVQITKDESHNEVVDDESPNEIIDKEYHNEDAEWESHNEVVDEESPNEIIDKEYHNEDAEWESHNEGVEEVPLEVQSDSSCEESEESVRTTVLV